MKSRKLKNIYSSNIPPLSIPNSKNSNPQTLSEQNPTHRESIKSIASIDSTSKPLLKKSRSSLLIQIKETSAFQEYFRALKESSVLFSLKLFSKKLPCVNYQDAESYLQDNEYILQGYRMGIFFISNYLLYRVFVC